MKNFTHLLFLIIFLTVTTPKISLAQTLVNQVQADSLGVAQPVINYNYQASTQDSATGLYIAINGYASGVQTEAGVMYIPTNGTGTPWATIINYNAAPQTYITGIYYKLGYVYISGFILDSAGQSSLYAAQLNAETGDTVFTRSYTGSYNGYTAASAVVVDDTGDIFVCGTEQAASGYQMALLKYSNSGALLWSSHYDSAGLYNGAVALVLSPSQIIITGYSGTFFNSWDFATISFSYSGTQLGLARSANGNGSFSQPVGLIRDQTGNIIVVGTAATVGSNTNIKVIEYDSSFTQKWVNTWGDSSSVTTAAAAQGDDNGHIMVAATSANASGGTDMVALTFLHQPGSIDDGTLNYARRISAANPSLTASGSAVTSDNNDNLIITGKIFNGTHYSMVTTSLDMSGNVQWQKSYNRAANTADTATAVLTDGDNNVYVFGTSMGADTVYDMVEYAQLPLSSTTFTDTAGKPIYLTGQIIIKVDSSAVIRSAVDNSKITFGTLNTYLHQWMVDSITTYLPKGINCQLAKIFINLQTTDTVSISRLGQRVPIPDFWSTFLLTFDGNYNESALCADLDQLFPLVQNTELDWVATLTSVITPNDLYYQDVYPYNTDPATQQFSLYPNITYPGSDVNVPAAWEYTAGQPYIKTGMVDDGLLLTHPDFIGYNSVGPTPSVAKGGYDFISNFTLPDDETSDAGIGHGTNVGGVIGAVRNNQSGVAGIAGGEDSIPGVSLYGFRIFNEVATVPPSETLASAHNLANGLVEIATQTPGNTYGWGMNIMNNSYQISSPNYSQLFADSGYYIDSNWSTLIDAYHYVNRNQVVQPASSGDGANDGENTAMIAPASFDSIWMFITGGTSLTGEWEGANWNGGSGPDVDQACIGAGMDIAAPYDSRLTYTTAIYNGTTPTGYTSFGGTSSAAALVSGAVSLLCGYLNDTVPSYQNVTPEDAEYIIERSATIIDNVRYDTLTGWGRLNIGAALQMADTAQRKLHHFDSDSLSVTNTASLLTSGIHIWLTERARNNNNTGQMFAPQGYNADIYKITCTMPLSIDSTDTLAAFWERPSSSYTYPYIRNDSSLIPHERLFIQSISPASATIIGYIYHLYDTATNVSIGWLPMDTAQAETANFAISVMVGDSIHVAVDTAITQIAKITTQYTQLSVFPNPATDNAVVKAASNCGGNVKLGMYDMQGIEIQSIFNGSLDGNAQSFPCSTSKLSAGMYFVMMQSDCETKSLKFVKF